MKLSELLIELLEEQLQVKFELVHDGEYTAASAKNAYGDTCYFVCEGSYCSAGLTDEYTPIELIDGCKVSPEIENSLPVFLKRFQDMFTDPIPALVGLGAGRDHLYIQYRFLTVKSKEELFSFMGRIMVAEKKAKKKWSNIYDKSFAEIAHILGIEKSVITDYWDKIRNNISIAESLT